MRRAVDIGLDNGPGAAVVGHQPQSDDRDGRKEAIRTARAWRLRVVACLCVLTGAPSISTIPGISLLLGHGTHEALKQRVQWHPCCSNFHGRCLFRNPALHWLVLCIAMQTRCKAMAHPTSRIRYPSWQVLDHLRLPGGHIESTSTIPPGSVIHGALALCNFPRFFASGERVLRRRG